MPETDLYRGVLRSLFQKIHEFGLLSGKTLRDRRMGHLLLNHVRVCRRKFDNIERSQLDEQCAPLHHLPPLRPSRIPRPVSVPRTMGKPLSDRVGRRIRRSHLGEQTCARPLPRPSSRPSRLPRPSYRSSRLPRSLEKVSLPSPSVHLSPHAACPTLPSEAQSPSPLPCFVAAMNSLAAQLGSCVETQNRNVSELTLLKTIVQQQTTTLQQQAATLQHQKSIIQQQATAHQKQASDIQLLRAEEDRRRREFDDSLARFRADILASLRVGRPL